MAHPYEYQLITHWFGDISRQTAELLDMDVKNFVWDLATKLDSTPDSEGWEVKSHSFTTTAGGAVISILLQRPRT